MKKNHLNLYMDIASRCAEMSYAKRLQVGAVIVKGDNIISHGWNGMPAGMDNNCEHEVTDGFYSKLVTNAEVLHAEENAICKVAKSTFSCEDAVMFCTHACCISCAKLISRSGIKKFYYRNLYRDESGIRLLENQKVEVIHYQI